MVSVNNVKKFPISWLNVMENVKYAYNMINFGFVMFLRVDNPKNAAVNQGWHRGPVVFASQHARAARCSHVFQPW